MSEILKIQLVLNFLHESFRNTAWYCLTFTINSNNPWETIHQQLTDLRRHDYYDDVEWFIKILCYRPSFIKEILKLIFKYK